MDFHRYVEEDSIDKLYERAIFNIFTGSIVDVRGFRTVEILGHTVRLNDVQNNILMSPVRDLNPKFMVAEWLWMLFGMNDVASISQYNSNIAKFSDDGKIFAGAYGPKIVNQLCYIERSLRRDKNSRQAIVNIWRENPQTSRDIPCTLNFQFLIRDGRLSGIVNMRSSDGWLGLPYDIFNFSQIVHFVAATFNEKPGFLQVNLGSSHLYEENWAQAQELMGSVLDHMRTPTFPTPPEIPYGLKQVLRRPKETSFVEMKEPWRRYARVLSARSRQEAWEDLAHFTKGGEPMDENQKQEVPVTEPEEHLSDSPTAPTVGEEHEENSELPEDEEDGEEF